MPRQAVDAVFFARHTLSNFRALYRRFPAPPATYTKDYFQLADQAEGILASSWVYTGDPIPLEYVWPGGTRTGEFLFSSDRAHLSWPTGGPQPWRIGDVLDGVTSIAGDSTKGTPAEADAEYERIKALGQGAWLVGVLLADQPRKMHVRVYFENPPAGFEARKVEDLPGQIRNAIAAITANVGTGALRAARPSPPPRAPALLQEIEQALARNPNVLLVGPPGTGKTVALEDLFAKFSSSGIPLFFDTDSWDSSAFTEGEAANEQRSEALVFHPSYSYENFVAGLYPRTKDNGTELYAVPGPLLRLGHWVGRSSRKALLIVDEFNRGPAAAIFGDTLGLLDKDKRSSLSKRGADIQRPFPDFNMRVAEEYSAYGSAGAKEIEKEVSLPAGLSIVAAMNSTDRSVAPLDAALRRRFHVIRVLPDYEVLAQRFGLPMADVDGAALPAFDDAAARQRKHVLTLAIRALRAINERVRFCLGEDFLLGHALLWGLGDSTDDSALPDLAAAMDGFVIATLRTTFLDQDDVLAAVLGIPDTAQRPAALTDVRLLGYWQNPPPGLDKIASRRLVLYSLRELPPEAQLASLAALAKP